MPRLFLFIEFTVLYFALPLAFRFSPRPLPALPLLWVVALYCYWQLRLDTGFSRNLLWNPAPLAGSLSSILLVFLVVGAILWIRVGAAAPHLLFSFVRQRPVLWGVVMVLYPILSVYPQGLIYRSFLIQRYTPLFSSHLMLIVISAVAFSFMHLIFRNWIAVALTFFGGLLFAWRYLSTDSLLVSSVEHAFYGCWLFTIGLGEYFYHGRIPSR